MRNSNRSQLDHREFSMVEIRIHLSILDLNYSDKTNFWINVGILIATCAARGKTLGDVCAAYQSSVSPPSPSHFFMRYHIVSAICVKLRRHGGILISRDGDGSATRQRRNNVQFARIYGSLSSGRSPATRWRFVSRLYLRPP